MTMERKHRMVNENLINAVNHLINENFYDDGPEDLVI